MTTKRIDPDDWHVAIGETDGPQLVVAGPGTGKTEFLVQRAAHLIKSGRARPAEIVVLTFSRRAAGELKSRIASALSQDGKESAADSVSAVDASTFHGFAYRLLEGHEHGEVGSVLTTPEQVALVGRLLADDDPARWPLPFRPLLHSPTFAEEVADFVLRCRERLLGSADLFKLAKDRADWRALPDFIETYDAALRREGRMDYGSLIAHSIDLLQGDRTSAGAQRYVLVDEYQDTSPAQARFLELLTSEHRNLTVAGDPYQSIYSFRGADLSNIADFPGRFNDLDGNEATRFILTTSHRVPAAIMDAAVSLTTSEDLPGAAGPVRPASHPGLVEAFVFDQQSAEAEWIASEVQRMIVELDIAPERIAILVRSKRRLLSELSRGLARRRIPHESPGSRLVDHRAIKMILDLARAATLDESLVGLDPVDRAVRRVLLGPLVGLGLGAERELLRWRQRTGASWAEAIIAELPEHEVLARLLVDPTWANELPAADAFWQLWTSLPLFREIVADPGRGEDRAALTSFAQALGRQSERDPGVSLVAYAALAESDDFEATPLFSTQTRQQGKVVVTTLHQAKGLEFDAVFIADASEGVFPDPRRSRSLLQPQMLAPSSRGDAGAQHRFRLQEEVRLAYTAMTRARTRVTWTATGAGIDEGETRPSRFLSAVAGSIGVNEPGPPPERHGRPVTPLELQAHLRRMAADPAVPGAQRLAAIGTLAHPRGRWNARNFAGFEMPGPDTGVVEMPLRLSPSQVDSYERCPRAYVLDRRLRLDPSASPYADFGTLIHAVLEQAENKRGPDQLGGSTLSDALEALEQRMPSVNFGSSFIRDAWRRRAEDLLEDLYNTWPADSRQPVALEQRMAMTVAGVEWVGIADRIERIGDGQLRIVDYKTSKSVPRVADAAGSLQLGFYVLAAMEDPVLAELGVPTEAELWYPAAIPKRWRFGFDFSHLPDVRRRLEEAGEGIATEIWTPKVSQACARCSVRMLCDRWPEGREAFVE